MTNAVESRFRIPYVRPCLLERNGHTIDAVVCNLSMLGVYVTFLPHAAKDMPEPGENVRVCFLLPGDPMPVDAEAVVTWQNVDDPGTVDSLPTGCGLRFVSLHPDDHHRIGALVHDYRHEPEPRVEVPRPHSGAVRVPYVQICVLSGAGGRWEGLLCNVSPVGAYVMVSPIPPVGEALHLSFTVSGGHALDVPCEVAWVNAEQPPDAEALPPGCGLRFTGLDDDARSRLQSLIREYESLPRPGLE